MGTSSFAHRARNAYREDRRWDDPVITEAELVSQRY
jgi:hypothetical protein